MLQKCANPVCLTQFRYLHQGKLLEVELEYCDTAPAGSVRQHGNRKLQIERWWICNQCAPRIRLSFDRRRGLVMDDSVDTCERVVTTSWRQWSAMTATGVSRASIRLVDLSLEGNLSRVQKLTQRLKRREVA